MKIMKKTSIIFCILLFFIFIPLKYAEATDSVAQYNKNSNVDSWVIVKRDDDSSQKILLNKELNLLSESAILIDSKSGNVIYSKNSDKKMYPASTTKVLTAILALENGNLDDITTVSYRAIPLIPSGYSSAYFLEGEEVSVRSLLEVLLVHSANDAANVLAEYVSGSIEDFVDLMNQKAIELGCKNSHFVNTNGIQNEDHYSTASDLAIISQYCMKNETFRELVSMEKCVIPATNKSDERKYLNTNDSIVKTSKYYRDDCIGIKTGFTSQAKNCIISACTNGEVELIAVLLYSPHLEDRYADLDTLYEYGYSVFPFLNINYENITETSTNVSVENLLNQSNIDMSSNDSNLFIFLCVLLFICIVLLVLLLFFNKSLQASHI